MSTSAPSHPTHICNSLMQAMQAQMMRQARDKTQNEMVVDTRSVTPFLPGAMEAFFYLTTSLPHYLTTSLPHYLHCLLDRRDR